MSETVAVAAPASHPVRLVVTDDLRRSRVTVFFRVLLAIPQLIWLSIWGIGASVAVVVAWFAALVTGRVPAGLHEFLVSYMRFSTRVNAYVLLLANPWPPFSSSGEYPVDAMFDGPEPQSRITVLLRLPLAIPAGILTYVFRAVNSALAFLGWFYALFTGRMHEGIRNTGAWLYRYELQTSAYLFLLTGRYPSLAGSPTV